VTARLLMLTILLPAVTQSLPAQQLDSHTLVYAVYQGEATAGVVLARMQKAQRGAGEQIESYALVSRTTDGKIALHERPSQPSPAIDATLAMLGDASAASTAIPKEVVDSLGASLAPGTSAVIAIMNDRWVKHLERDLHAARARAIMFTPITEGESDDSR